MESLELPQDILIWDSNQSPELSPDHFSIASVEYIFEDSLATEFIPQEDDLIKPNTIIEFSPEFTPEFSPEMFEELLEIQQDLLDTMENDTLSNDQWMDQPINVPLDECTPVQGVRAYPVKNTAQLLNEFNEVYDSFELTHLTPPETPPHSPAQTSSQANLNDSKNQFYSHSVTNYQLEQNQQCKPMINYAVTPAINTQQTILQQAINLVQQSNVFADDVAMAEVEDLIRSRAEDLVESSIDDDSSICGSSTCFSPRSETSSSNTDDSDWMINTNPAIATALKNKQTKQKRKPRTNRRSLEDRQSRKKEQNKTAANRYRLKKKAEIEILLDEEQDLIKRNEELSKQYKQVGQEVKTLKSLLRELFSKKLN